MKGKNINDVRHNSVNDDRINFVDLKHALSYIRPEFPRVANSIELMWCSPELEKYFNELVMFVPTSARATRKGFPPDIMKAIFFAQKLHDKEYANIKPVVKTTPWDIKPR